MRNNAAEFLITIFLFFVALSTACDNPFSEEKESPPVLSVSTNSLDFSDNLNNLTFAITDSGEDKLEWTISSTEEWIDISPDSGTTEDEKDIINVTVDRTNLVPDDYIGIISVTSNGGEQSIVASLTRNPAPVLATSTSSIDFSTDNITDQIIIRNTGIGVLNWKVTDDKDWIALSPAVGSTLSESDTITVSVSRTDLAVGNHLGLLVIESNGGNVEILVNISVEAIPSLSVTPIIIDFGSNESLSQLSIQNIGGGSLSWRVNENLTWISVSPDSGIVTTETDVLNVTADREVLEPGEYSGLLSVITNGGVQDVSVSLSKESEPIPNLNVTPIIIDFGSNESLSQLSIQNVGGGSLSWQISENLTWISVSPDTGTATSETDFVNVTADRDVLEPGEYSGLLTVITNGGAQDVSVSLSKESEPIPILNVTPIIIDFGSIESLNQLSIQNVGGGSLSWQVSENLTWISVSPDTGTATSETDFVNVTADRDVLEPGEYSGLLTVITNGGVQDVSVSLSKESEPILEVSPLVLDFGSTDTLLTFSISNLGEGLLTWNVIDDMAWLTMSPVQGSVFSGTDTVKAVISRFDLVSDNYTGRISITSDGGNTEILVEMVVP